MRTGIVTQLLLMISLMGTMSSAVADKSEHLATIVKAHAASQKLLKDKDVEGAIRNAESTYNLSVDTLGEQNPNTANLAIFYAQLLGATGDKNRAYKLYDVAVKALKSRYGENDLRLVSPLLEMAEYVREEQRVAMVDRALAIQTSQAPEDKLGYANAARVAGALLAKHENTRTKAQEVLEEVIAVYEIEYGKDAPELIDSLMLLGNASAGRGKTSTPKHYYRRALGIAKKSLPEEQHATLSLKTGESLMRYSASRDALPYLRKAHKQFDALFGSEDRRTAMAALALGRFHMATQKEGRAEPFLLQSLSYTETDPNYRNHQLTALSLLVEMHEKKGNRDAATPYCRAIGEITPWTETQDYKPVFKRAPKYPSSAVSARSEGYAVVEYTVDSNGFVQDPKIVDIKGHDSFRQASIDAAEKFRYAPAFVDGQPIETPGVRNKFTYQLRR